jgi:hypothetical protein
MELLWLLAGPQLGTGTLPAGRDRSLRLLRLCLLLLLRLLLCLLGAQLLAGLQLLQAQAQAQLLSTGTGAVLYVFHTPQ